MTIIITINYDDDDDNTIIIIFVHSSVYTDPVSERYPFDRSNLFSLTTYSRRKAVRFKAVVVGKVSFQ